MKYYDVSQWGDIWGQSTIGTREKEILINPDSGKIYFLKYSMCKPNRDYATEYWSEIIAYELGKKLGFNTLEYNLAEKRGRFGCISENMVDTDCEQLIEGYSILSDYDRTYNPEDKSQYHKYTFSFVCKALKKYGYERFIYDFINILIFDAIIGNSDRHQGNWGIIHKRDVMIEEKERKPLKIVINNLKVLKLTKKAKKEDISRDVMSPIYDSGCCLGREFSEEDIAAKLKNNDSFNSFIRKSKAELRRDDEPMKKVSHFELLEFIMSVNSDYKRYIEDRIQKICNLYNDSIIKDLIENIDSSLSEKIRKKCGMSIERRQFIIRVLTTRIEKLKELVQYVSEN